jgi:hypothetical protein
MRLDGLDMPSGLDHGQTFRGHALLTSTRSKTPFMVRYIQRKTIDLTSATRVIGRVAATYQGSGNKGKTRASVSIAGQRIASLYKPANTCKDQQHLYDRERPTKEPATRVPPRQSCSKGPNRPPHHAAGQGPTLLRTYRLQYYRYPALARPPIHANPQIMAPGPMDPQTRGHVSARQTAQNRGSGAGRVA